MLMTNSRLFQDLTTVLPQLDDAGRDLFKNLICNAPGQRLSAKKAMRHPFLGSIDTQSPPSGEGSPRSLLKCVVALGMGMGHYTCPSRTSLVDLPCRLRYLSLHSPWYCTS